MCFKKSLCKDKSKCSTAKFHYISITLALTYIKSKLYKTLDYWFRDMLNFDFRRKGLEIVFPPRLANDFSRNMLFMLYSINWPIFIGWLLLEILGNMCITNIWFQGYDVINSEAKLIILIKIFLFMTKKSSEKFNYLENKNSFKAEIKNRFSTFLRGFQLPKNVSDLKLRF